MFLESLNDLKFEPLSKEQLLNVKGGGDLVVNTKPSGDVGNGYVVYHGQKYYCQSDEYTLNDVKEITKMKIQLMDSTWVDIT